MLVLLHQRKRK
ncbi:hypothetical protein VCHC02A1_2534, partial [Vibrio cholerae HC-02A1]